MSISGLEQVSSRSETTSTSSSKQVMGKDDFLHLLVTQMQAQDPLNPMDSTAFTAQLAQFSSLEQLQNINSSLGTLGTSQAVMTNSQAVGFIGKTIKAVGDSIEVQDGQSQTLQFALNKNAAGLYAKIYDAQGNFVRQIEKGATETGEHSLAWDGRDYLGGKVPDGTYTYAVAAIDDLGNSIPLTQFTSGEVTGVHFQNGVAYLQCGSREVPMGNVVQVREE
ncbi:MAG: hypothetical protein VR64_16885 [Desulfatitalea sp. BRH_c12]|nr:MAG: hypothetical protein VR64_16885 [Desulfatitalea sp. BRH_c12]